MLLGFNYDLVIKEYERWCSDIGYQVSFESQVAQLAIRSEPSAHYLLNHHELS